MNKTYKLDLIGWTITTGLLVSLVGTYFCMPYFATFWTMMPSFLLGCYVGSIDERDIVNGK